MHSPSSDPKKVARAAYMRAYYHAHPEYAAKVKARAHDQHDRIMADPVLRERERARCRDKERRLRHQQRPRDPEKKRARTLAESAVRCGRLVQPACCEDCDGTENRIEAHHEDYSRPLDVEWLCSICHGKRHRKAA